MTVSTTTLAARVDALLDLFNRGSLDLPEGVLDRNAIFRLNGVAYGEGLGRPDDPLVRLIARGPGAYRFLAKAVRYALPDARASLGTLTRSPIDGGIVLRGEGRLEGSLRGSGDRFEEPCFVALTFQEDGRLVGLDVELDESHVARILAARAADAGGGRP